MKKRFLRFNGRGMSSAFSLSVLASALLTFTGCTDECTVTYTDLIPQFADLEDIRSAPMSMVGPRDVNRSGKIYYYQDMLLINEIGEGIHIYDNRNPASPMAVGFLEIPGNIDMAVANDVLYADSYIDLVTFDVSNWQMPTQLGRMENLYESWGYPMRDGLHGWYNETTGQLIVDFLEEEVTVDNGCGGSFVMWDRTWGGPVMLESASFDSFVAPGGGSGQGGSMARFTVAANRLYAVDEWQLHVVGLDNPTAPIRTNQVSLGWGVETIFPYQDMLFFGTTTGMIINSIEDPDAPRYRSTIDHALACDPVVVQDGLAYYTIRSGNNCGQANDQLGVVDISNPDAPVEIATYNMDGPYGLGIDGDALFICEGDDGLKVYDASEYDKIGSRMVKRYRDVHAWDVIPLGDVLLMVGEDGLYQYDYSDLDNIHQVSHIATR